MAHRHRQSDGHFFFFYSFCSLFFLLVVLCSTSAEIQTSNNGGDVNEDDGVYNSKILNNLRPNSDVGGGGDSSSSSPSSFPTPSTNAKQTCTQVRQIYDMKHLGLPETVPTSPVNGNELQICKSESSCCTKEMEEKFYEVVRTEFSNIMQSTSSYLKNLVSTNVAKFQESFLEMVHTSENNTNILFSDVYKNMAGQAQVLIDKLYGGLADFLQGKDVDLEVITSGFFNGLFPLVYHHSINPKLKDFNDDYKECLQETQAEIKPFGDVPHHISVLVSKSFQAARTFLHALQLGVEVINSTDHLEIGPECQRALMRLLYCPKCQGLVTAKSCNGYCMNVVRGCLANMAEIDQPWNDFVLALDRLTNSMKGGFVLEDVTSGLDTKISEAIMYAMENGPELSKKVKNACGHPKRAARDLSSSSVASEEAIAAAKVASSVHTANPSLLVLLQSFMRSLLHSKSFYASLSDTLCSDDSLAVRTESNCWNGETLGEYTKTIAGNGISAQKYNPEIKMQHWRDEKISLLIDKLKRMKQILNTRTMSLPESDSMLVNDGSGSGWGYNSNNNFGDDEDYSYGSGSGYYEENRNYDKANRKQTGQGKTDGDLGFPGEDEDRKPSITLRPTSSSSKTSSTVATSLSSCLLLSAAFYVLRLSLPWLNG